MTERIIAQLAIIIRTNRRQLPYMAIPTIVVLRPNDLNSNASEDCLLSSALGKI